MRNTESYISSLGISQAMGIRKDMTTLRTTIDLFMNYLRSLKCAFQTCDVYCMRGNLQRL